MGKSCWKRLTKYPGIAVVVLLILAGGSLFSLRWFCLRPIDFRITATVKLDHIPAGISIVGEPAKYIEVRIRGPKSLIKVIRQKAPRIYSADLSHIRIGVNRLEIEYGNFFFPKGISIDALTPSSLIIAAEREIKKSVPVKVVLSGKPDAGYMIADAVLDPSEADLKGAESALASVRSVKTKPVDIAGIRASIRREAVLDLPENIAPVFSAKRITAQIVVAENILTKNISDIPVAGENTVSEYEIIPPTIHLKIRGPENLLKMPSIKDEIEVFLDLKGLTPGVYARHATIRLPVNVTLVSVTPEIFTVKLKSR
jgi:YbbR domain-containing protein